MKDTTASWTAQWVAWMRHLASQLPAGEELVRDPYAARFVDPFSPIQVLPARGPVRMNIYAMQLRTRFIDDEVRAFHADAGRQVVILGAGFDTRATRLALPGLTYFEVDHPATQRAKRAAMGAPPAVRYLTWHFERDALSRLPAALAAQGHDPTRPTLVLWEGVTMYLTPRAIEDTLAAVRTFGPGSRLVFNYVDARRMTGLRWAARPERAFVRLVGEPMQFGFHPDEITSYFAQRGFDLTRDESYRSAAERYYGPAHRRRGDAWRRLGLARVR